MFERLGIFAALLTLAIAGCSAESMKAHHAEQINKVEKQLPEGCTFHDFGNYYNMNVVAVVCDGRPTTSTNYRWSSGKTQKNAVTVHIDR